MQYLSYYRTNAGKTPSGPDGIFEAPACGHYGSPPPSTAAYTGLLAPSLRSAPVGAKRASTGRSAPPKVSARESCVRLVPGLGVTCNARRASSGRSAPPKVSVQEPCYAADTGRGVTCNCKDRTLLRGSCLTLALFIRWVRLRHHFDVFDSSSSFAFSSDSILAISCSAVARFWRPSS